MTTTMTKNEILDIVKSWEDEDVKGRSVIIVLSEKDGDKDGNYTSVQGFAGDDKHLLNALYNALRTNPKFKIMAQAASNIINQQQTPQAQEGGQA